MRQFLRHIQTLCFSLAATGFAAGCDQYDDVNGSFQEAVNSPRIEVKLDDHTYRYFRFHLRQFDDAVSGTFETFDMNSYDLFNQVPILMDNPLNLYYCARIDYGYIRNNSVHIVIRDKEQRQWTFIAKLGKSALSGEIYRTGHSGIALVGADPEYMLEEDAAYMSESQANTSHFILESMKDSDASLKCIYYYRSHNLFVVLPESFPLKDCMPSAKQCHNFRLAIVGTHPVRKLFNSSPLLINEVLSAYLDSCDLQDNYKRSINLRDNPNTRDGIRSNYFIATAVIFEDLNMDGIWNTDTEPVLASLDAQTLMFYDTIPESSIYGESPEGETYQAPVLSQSQIDSTTGWHLYNDESETTENLPYIRILKHLTPISGNALSLMPIHLNPEDGKSRGCYLHPQDDSKQIACDGILPVLVQ